MLCMFRTLALGLLLALVSLLSACPLHATEKPNILFIFTDDQAPWALGLSKHPYAHTPHLDKLFQEGAYLVNAFTVTPVCSPSRASLMTSRYGSELGITDWLHPRNEPKKGLAADIPTWPKLLSDAGYRTGLVGKWHLGLLDEQHPTVFGFQYFMGFRSGGSVPKDPVLEVNGVTKKVMGLTPDILTDDAMKFIQKNKEQPFLLSLHFRAPHARWLPVAEEDWKPFADLDPKVPHPDYPKLDTKRVKKMTREYLASVASVDRNVGRLLKLLDEENLREKTIVIFSSDHGYNMGHNGIWHKGNGHWVLTDPPPGTKNIPRGQRPNLYDHSLRVPTAIRWPGVIKPGTVVPETMSNLDWFPTILEMADVQLPAKVLVRGKSFVPVLQGNVKAKEDWNNDFYAEYSTKHQSRTHMRGYRTPRFKLIRDFLNDGRDELYDLQNDSEEKQNLILSEEESIQQIRDELDRKIREQMKKLNDPVLKKE